MTASNTDIVELAPPFPWMGKGGDGVEAQTSKIALNRRQRQASPIAQRQRVHPHPCPAPIEGAGFQFGSQPWN
jgi:hypothetical protein